MSLAKRVISRYFISHNSNKSNDSKSPEDSKKIEKKTVEEDEPNYFDFLPDDIGLEICKFLPMVDLVRICRVQKVIIFFLQKRNVYSIFLP